MLVVKWACDFITFDRPPFKLINSLLLAPSVAGRAIVHVQIWLFSCLIAGWLLNRHLLLLDYRHIGCQLQIYQHVDSVLDLHKAGRCFWRDCLRNLLKIFLT